MGLNKKSAILVSLASLAFMVSGCASLPFSHKKDDKIKKDDERISVIGKADEIKPDSYLSGINIEVPAASDVTQWPDESGMPNASVANANGDGSLSVQWKKNIGPNAKDSNMMIASPIYAQGYIFVEDARGSISAIDAISGKTIWSHNNNTTKTKGWFSPKTYVSGGGIAFEDNRIIAASANGDVYALDASNGKELWRVSNNTMFRSSPLISNGKVYIVDVNSQLYAFDTSNGSTVWTLAATPEAARMSVASSSVISNDILVTPFPSGEIIATAASNGHKIWSDTLSKIGSSTSLASINDIAGHPVIYDGVVYAGSQSGILTSIDLRTGARGWERPIHVINSPWVSGLYLYVISTDAKIYCVEKATGAIAWIKDLKSKKDTKGKKKARNNKIVSWTGPIMVAGRLVVASSNGTILELNPQNGDVLNEIETKQSFYLAPIVANGTVYLYSNNNKLFALQ